MSSRNRRPAPRAQQAGQQVKGAAEVKGVAVPKAAAERIQAALAAATTAQRHAQAMIEVVQAALGAPEGSNLVQMQESGEMFFMPPVEAVQPPQPHPATGPAPKPQVLPPQGEAQEAVSSDERVR